MRFTEDHVWIRKSGNKATVGLTRHAIEELGEIIYVELPEVGSEIKAGDEAVGAETTKSVVDIYTPASGRITEVQDNVEQLNADPEREGWLFKMQLTDPEAVDQLLSQEQYHDLINS